MSERLAAVLALLQLPDPPELKRGHVLRLEGTGWRFQQWATWASQYPVIQRVARETERLEA